MPTPKKPKPPTISELLGRVNAEIKRREIEDCAEKVQGLLKNLDAMISGETRCEKPRSCGVPS